MRDISIVVANDYTHRGLIHAERHASLVSQGALDNEGQLNAGDTLSVRASTINNTAQGRIEGKNVDLNVNVNINANANSDRMSPSLNG